MQETHEAVRAAVASGLAELGYPDTTPHLMQLEPQRGWGLSTNVCFRLGKDAAADEIARQTDGLKKKERKQVAARLAAEAGERLAAELAARLTAVELPLVARVEAAGAYVNFHFDTTRAFSDVVAATLNAGDDYGKAAPTGRRIMVEYAQPNTHKDFHVGHLRNASIGQAIANLLEQAGNDVLKATYIGDIGRHVALAIWADKVSRDSDSEWRRGNKEVQVSFQDLPLGGLDYWPRRYKCARKVEAFLKSKVNTGTPELVQHFQPKLDQFNREVLGWMRSWEAGDEQARNEWQQSRDLFVNGGWIREGGETQSAHIEGLSHLFSELRLSLSEDCWFYESTVEDTKLGQRAAEELKELGIAEVDESEEYKGALYVDFEKQADAVHPDGTPVFRDDEKKHIRKLGKMTILRSDGTSLYQTKELGLAKHKFDNFEIDESLYVVGAEQRLYFQQVFAILRLWGFPNAENCRHIAYELVVLPEGKMSSREGTIVSYRALRDEAIRRAEKITREKGIAGNIHQTARVIAYIHQTARVIAIAAIKYTMLQISGNQQIVFDFEQALSFSGRAAPYLQYAYARAGKLVGDSAAPPRDAPSYELHPSEVELARVISEYPEVCANAAEQYEPALVCNYLYELANAFSAFYRDCRVLDAPAEEQAHRQALVAAFRTVLASGFRVLALPLPEEM